MTVIDTPEGINMWVLLSRRHQLALQMKGIKTPGIIKWAKENLGPEASTAKRAALMLENLIAQHGGPENEHTNWHVSFSVPLIYPVFIDGGVYNTMEQVNDAMRSRMETLVERGVNDPQNFFNVSATWDSERGSNGTRYVMEPV